MTITYINCVSWLGQSSLLWGYFFFKMVTNPFLPSPPINNLIIVHQKYISFSSNRTISLNGHPRVTLKFINQWKYHHKQHPRIGAKVLLSNAYEECMHGNKERQASFEPIINKQNAELNSGLSNSLSATSYLTWLCCCSWMSTWFEHIHSRLKRHLKSQT